MTLCTSFPWSCLKMLGQRDDFLKSLLGLDGLPMNFISRPVHGTHKNGHIKVLTPHQNPQTSFDTLFHMAGALAKIEADEMNWII